jgi:hypothetical protein
MMAIRATRPMVKPTAPPVPSPPPLLFCERSFCELPVAVGITVIVWTWPMVVKTEIIGVMAADVAENSSLDVDWQSLETTLGWNI